jgi:multiple sugar transport system substrate-binding protein
VAHFAWLGYLQPLDRFVSQELRRDLLPSLIAQGTWRDRLYALGAYDSGLAIFGNRRYLRAADVRLATVDRPWTLDEFEDALQKLGAVPGVDYPIDMKINYGRGEFFTFAFSPILQSMGGDLIDRRTYAAARGVLDGPQSVAAMTRLQRWFQKGWANPRPTDDEAFTSRKAALSWVGHWAYTRYAEALGDDLVLLPMPDFGQGPKTGLGAWTFAICHSCRDPEAAWALLRHTLRRDNILRWTSLHAGVPAPVRAGAGAAVCTGRRAPRLRAAGAAGLAGAASDHPGVCRHHRGVCRGGRRDHQGRRRPARADERRQAHRRGHSRAPGLPVTGVHT